MKSFFTTVLAVLTALVSLFVLSVVLFVAIGLTTESDAPKVQENSLLKINLSGSLEDRAIENPLAELNLSSLGLDGDLTLGLNELMAGLNQAATDDNIQGILLDQGVFSAGYGALEEFGDYLKEFKSISGKPVYSYGEYYTQKGAYLASYSDSTILHPGGIYDLRGIGISSTYYKAFFEKIGVEPLVVRGTGNKFKAAVEPFISNEMSEENRLQLTHLTSQFWNFISNGLSQKGLNQKEIDSCANQWVGMNAAQIEASGLVDALGYREDVIKSFEERYEILNWSSYKQSLQKKTAKDRVAVIYANGTIGNGTGDESSIGTKNIIKALEKANNNKRVKAIVLRVNSPGGSALTSDIIHHTIEGVQKPIVVSQGNYAASGGYYISCNADAIFTNSTTITGSIGIFMSLFTAEELINQKLGLTIEEVQTHPFANFPNLYRHPTVQQYALLQRMIDFGYDDFTGKVAAGRDTTMEYVKSIGGGRMWSGNDAVANGLADYEGNLKDAIAFAAELGEVSDYRIYELPNLDQGIERYLKAFTSISSSSHSTSNNVLQMVDQHPAMLELKSLIENPGMQARMNPIFRQFND